MKKNIKKIFSNKKPIIAMWVVALTLCVIGVSYSAFFTVKTNTNNQTVSTGTLSVAYGGQSSSITRFDMQPTSDEEGLSQDGSSIIHVQNNGTLDANYVLTIGYDMENFLARSDYNSKDKLTPVDYIRFAVYEYSANESKLIAGPLSIADLPLYKVDTNDTRNNRYAILFGTLGAVSNATKTYQVKIWLSDKATASISSSYFYVNSEIVAEAEDTKIAYNLMGVLKNENGEAINGATVSIQNNSLIATTNETGSFALNGILPGTYNVDITHNNKKYSANLTIRDGEKKSIVNIGANFTPSENMNLATAAYTYGTTINKLMELNKIDSNSSSFSFENSKTYLLDASYILTTDNNADISNLIITLNDNKITNFTLE